MWKASPSDPEVDAEEWVIFLDRIQEHFRRHYENFPDEFYFWGDFSGDRTLDFKATLSTVLTRVCSQICRNIYTLVPVPRPHKLSLGSDILIPWN